MTRHRIPKKAWLTRFYLVEKDIAMREKGVAPRHQKLDRKESQIEEKSKIFEMAIQMNEFR